MQISGIDQRRGAVAALAAGVLGGLAAATIAIPTASAQPGCTAAGLSSALGTVSTATGQHLRAQPAEDDVIASSGARAPGDSENAIRAYFVAQPQEWAVL